MLFLFYKISFCVQLISMVIIAKALGLKGQLCKLRWKDIESLLKKKEEEYNVKRRKFGREKCKEFL